MNLSTKPYLFLAVLFSCLCFSGCELAEDDITNGAATAPIVVRGAYSYMLSIDAKEATIDLRDSAAWNPHVAYLSITVSGYSAGTGALEISDSSGTRVCIDSIKGNMEILNRRLSSKMPLRLRLSLHGFTGAIICGLQLGPTDINGMVAHFTLRDSMGVDRSSFNAGESIDFSYSVVNMTDKPHNWATGDSRPLSRFTVTRGDSIVRDSFQGVGWIQVPRLGTVYEGETLRFAWRGISSQTPLPPGQYRAVAEPQFVLTDLGFLPKQELAFEIKP